jgi:hypothetical protein
MQLKMCCLQACMDQQTASRLICMMMTSAAESAAASAAALPEQQCFDSADQATFCRHMYNQPFQRPGNHSKHTNLTWLAGDNT